MSRIIVKMTDFWRLLFPSRSWSLATLCDTLITFREYHLLLRLIWRFSESVSEYESVFGICVWIIIYKRKLWYRKIFWPSCWTPTIAWNVLRQWKHQRQENDEIFSPRKLWRVYMLHASMLNSSEPNRSSCTQSESCRLCHRISHWSWAAWWRYHNFFCKNNPSKTKRSRNRNNCPNICWKFIWSNENAIYVDFFNWQCKSFDYLLLLDHINYWNVISKRLSALQL